jgi:hypothetical protein
MKYKKLTITFTALLLNSCAFGVSSLKVNYPTEQNLVSSAPGSSKAFTAELEPGLSVTAEWVGNAYPVVTSKSIIGLSNRYVIPYTKLTSLVNFKIVNKTNKFIDFKINNIKLKTLPDNLEFQPLTMDFFKNRWPSFAVKSQEMLIDQSTAIGEVIRTLLRDRMVEPDSVYSGYLAFSRIPAEVMKVSLTGILKIDNKESNITFDFKKNEKI